MAHTVADTEGFETQTQTQTLKTHTLLLCAVKVAVPVPSALQRHLGCNSQRQLPQLTLRCSSEVRRHTTVADSEGFEMFLHHQSKRHCRGQAHSTATISAPLSQAGNKKVETPIHCAKRPLTPARHTAQLAPKRWDGIAWAVIPQT
jgi:hypothetical protein